MNAPSSTQGTHLLEKAALAASQRAFRNKYSDFYRRHFFMREFQDWQEVPFVTREILMRTPWKHRLFVAASDVEIIRPTSGTSGKGILLVPRMSGRDDFSDPLQRSLYIRNSIRRIATFSGAQPRHACSFEECFDASSVLLDPSDIPSSAKLAARYQPDMLAGFAYAIEALLANATFAPHTRKVRVLQLFGEKPSVSQWELFTKTFSHAEILSEYASVEAQSGLAAGCSELVRQGSQSIHPFESYVYVEVRDTETGAPCTNVGEVGELVITLLRESALPLIRYRTGDLVRIMPKCACGRSTYEVEGRLLRDRIRVRGGEILSSEIERALKSISTELTSTAYEAFFGDFRKEGSDSGPLLRLAIDTNTSLGALRKRLEDEIHISPTKTYADAVREFGFRPLEVLRRTNADLRKKKGIQPL